MSDVTNPHDRLIRETLQDKEDAISFFKYNLPKNVQDLLDLNKLELSQSSFISENLKEEQTDLLFQIPLKSGEKTNVYLLFEHKSYLDDSVFSQLLGYISAIYKSQYKADKKYSVVIPFVFYHGESLGLWEVILKIDLFFRKTKKKYLKNTFLILNWNFLICLKWI
nr:Rpn family recombination-promoting nuclease/putative transposase [Leptospira santarosai]